MASITPFIRIDRFESQNTNVLEGVTEIHDIPEGHDPKAMMRHTLMRLVAQVLADDGLRAGFTLSLATHRPDYVVLRWSILDGSDRLTSTIAMTLSTDAAQKFAEAQPPLLDGPAPASS